MITHKRAAALSAARSYMGVSSNFPCSRCLHGDRFLNASPMIRRAVFGGKGALKVDISRGLISLFAMTCLTVALAGCGSSKSTAYKGAYGGGTGEGGHYKVGKPYQIFGVWYYPREDEKYDATGIASWYGPQFHGKRTANGEIFDQEAITAAHPTLPMPVFARVTNLENGRSLVVRINDRGPFAAGREIDLSRRSAEILGFERKGTAKVRVQYIGRAPLPGQPGLGEVRYAGSVGETFVAPKAQLEEDEKRVAAVASSSIAASSLDAPTGVASAPPPQISALPAPVAAPAQALPPAPPTQPVVHQMPVPAATGIYVQVGAFQSIQNAERVRNQIATYGNAHISQAMVQGTPYYRVRVGPMSDVSVADASLQTIVQDGHPGARIVVE